MPQDSIFPTDTRWTGLQVEFEQVATTQGPAWVINIRRKSQEGAWRLVWQGQWRGVMMDMAGTMAEDATAAFLFGEPKDLVRAAAGVHKLARSHYKTYDIG